MINIYKSADAHTVTSSIKNL